MIKSASSYGILSQSLTFLHSDYTYMFWLKGTFEFLKDNSYFIDEYFGSEVDNSYFKGSDRKKSGNEYFLINFHYDSSKRMIHIYRPCYTTVGSHKLIKKIHDKYYITYDYNE
jgi:hypothetical protein